METDGILLIDKPSGITSSGVVMHIRKRFGRSTKVGHAGTLDPLATGLLVLLVGRGTKLSGRISEMNKSYNSVMKLGVETDTQDREGHERPYGNGVFPDESEIYKILQSFVGKIEQVPPMFSAKKVKGERLYRLARKGSVVEREPKEVEIFEIILNKYDPPFLHLAITCSKGTYIRTFCQDFGQKAGCGGYLWFLERNSIGPFYLDNSFSMDAFEKLPFEELSGTLIPVETAISRMEEWKEMK
ncbi:MAG: tRNA pseudouridine(55) synthase TruB [Candidatus Theseobacter exili]|nr:tRNA pseudouridine(55) synthase TruB [Candidatus Theseobacter exili]